MSATCKNKDKHLSRERKTWMQQQSVPICGFLVFYFFSHFLFFKNWNYLFYVGSYKINTAKWRHNLKCCYSLFKKRVKSVYWGISLCLLALSFTFISNSSIGFVHKWHSHLLMENVLLYLVRMWRHLVEDPVDNI